MNKLTPENQALVKPDEYCFCGGKGIIHRTYYKGDILSGEVDFERDEPCEVCAERERIALAIQNATAQKCAEIAMAEYRRTELMNEQYHEGASVELNCSASTATTILHAIREAFGLAPENEEG